MPKVGFKKSGFKVIQKTIVFHMENDAALFTANDKIGSGKAFVNVCNSIYPSPVLIGFSRGIHTCGFAMSKSEAKRMCLYILHQL